MTLTKTTVLDRVDVNEEQGEGYEDSLVDCGKDDTNIPVEQERALFREDVPARRNHVDVRQVFVLKLLTV